MLHESRGHHLNLLGTLRDGDLEDRRPSPRGGSRSVLWYVHHTMQHECYHLGQIALYAKLWG